MEMAAGAGNELHEFGQPAYESKAYRPAAEWHLWQGGDGQSCREGEGLEMQPGIMLPSADSVTLAKAAAALDAAIADLQRCSGSKSWSSCWL